MVWCTWEKSYFPWLLKGPEEDRSVGQKWFVDGKTSDENNKITIENNEIILSPVTHSIIVVVFKFVQSLYSHREYT